MVRYGRKDMAWLIIPISLLPDIDHFNDVLWDYGILPWEVRAIPNLHIGMFHTVVMVAIVAIILFVIVKGFSKLPAIDIAIYSVIGYSAHLIEDYLVYPSAYQMLFPFTTKFYGNNFIPETGDLGIAGARVLGLGLLLLVVAFGLRRYCESIGWMKNIDGEEE